MQGHALQWIKITDEDIDDVEHLFRDVTFDSTRRDIIKDLNDLDVQAFPGTGKTTLLVAKLAILAKKWPYEHKGICVLSHTNVAREEIENRLGSTDVGKRLLSYPHFIGTVHSFCNTYIGLPWLRSHKYPFTLIDNDIVLERRWNMLSYGTKIYMTNRHKSQSVCQAIDIPIRVDIGCSETTKSYQEVKQCVKNSFFEGYFTYVEMLYWARYALTQNPIISKAVQNRFPIVFIDEAQDTYSLQWSILDQAFSDSLHSVKQYFGDYNQAIFNSNDTQANEEHKIIQNQKTIIDSHRFGTSIAKIVDNLSTKESGLQGTYNASDRPHTIFLFDKNNIKAVLKAYAKLLLTTFSDKELNGGNLKCYAVGMVHMDELSHPSDLKFPKSVKDYWDEYQTSYGKSKSCKTMLEFFNQGRVSQSHSDYWVHIESLASALIRIINSNVKKGRIFFHNCALRALISQLKADQQNNFRKELLKISHMPFETKEEWENIVRHVIEVLTKFFNINISKDNNFFCWDSQKTGYSDDGIKEKEKNVYVYCDELTERTVKIYLGSIHSVKGQTHLATMAVETHWYDSNIKKILPWLSCQNADVKADKRNTHRLKCHYVALSRAREMICLALPKDFITNEQQDLLKGQGWNLVNI